MKPSQQAITSTAATPTVSHWPAFNRMPLPDLILPKPSG